MKVLITTLAITSFALTNGWALIPQTTNLTATSEVKSSSPMLPLDFENAAVKQSFAIALAECITESYSKADATPANTAVKAAFDLALAVCIDDNANTKKTPTPDVNAPTEETPTKAKKNKDKKKKKNKKKKQNKE